MFNARLYLLRIAAPLFVFYLLLSATSCEKINSDATTGTLLSSGEDNNVFAASARPNIILVVGDDIGYEIPAYTGGQSYATPNIDRMAQQGMQFTQCYSLPMCSPSRFEILTGKYNNRNYFGDSWDNLDRSQRTIANMLRNAGYKTCIAGKWQLNGGDTSIHTFGFDTYSITDPFKLEHYGKGDLNLYKNPTIYRNGAYLPAAQMQGKYGEDVNRNFLFRFIDSNKGKAKPFFAMWTPNLCHKPFSPTPDDAAFATWDPNKEPTDADTIYFPSMVQYFDKEIGMLMNKLQAADIASNTIVLFVVGDNGTDNVITSLFNGRRRFGGKGETNDRGIHVPMIAYCPAKIAGGQVNNNIVDFTDILPTLAGIAGISVPTNFGILDGISFAPQLFNQAYTPRTYSFGYYDVNRYGPDNIPAYIYSFGTTYKEYKDSSTYKFYNHVMDINEKKPILPAKMTAAQRTEDSTLKSVIDYYLK